MRTSLAILLFLPVFHLSAGAVIEASGELPANTVDPNGDTVGVLKNPQHPCTNALIACIPKLGSKDKRLRTIDYGWLEPAG